MYVACRYVLLQSLFLLQVVKDTLIPALVCHATLQAAKALEFIASSCDVVGYMLTVSSVFLRTLRTI